MGGGLVTVINIYIANVSEYSTNPIDLVLRISNLKTVRLDLVSTA